jgi:hypothetical protein
MSPRLAQRAFKEHDQEKLIRQEQLLPLKFSCRGESSPYFMNFLARKPAAAVKCSYADCCCIPGLMPAEKAPVTATALMSSHET